MATAEEKYKISAETWWCIVAAELADAAESGRDFANLLQMLDQQRRLEHANIPAQRHLSAIARQIADAHRSGRSTAALILQLRRIRRVQLHGPERS